MATEARYKADKVAEMVGVRPRLHARALAEASTEPDANYWVAVGKGRHSGDAITEQVCNLVIAAVLGPPSRAVTNVMTYGRLVSSGPKFIERETISPEEAANSEALKPFAGIIDMPSMTITREYGDKMSGGSLLREGDTFIQGFTRLVDWLGTLTIEDVNGILRSSDIFVDLVAGYVPSAAISLRWGHRGPVWRSEFEPGQSGLELTPPNPAAVLRSARLPFPFLIRLADLCRNGPFPTKSALGASDLDDAAPEELGVNEVPASPTPDNNDPATRQAASTHTEQPNRTHTRGAMPKSQVGPPQPSGAGVRHVGDDPYNGPTLLFDCAVAA